MGKRVGHSTYFSSLFSLLVSTAKGINGWFLLIILIDLLFYAGAFGMMTYASSSIKEGYDALEFPNPAMQTITEEEAQKMLAQMESFRSETFTTLGILAIAFIVWWSLCKGAIWCVTLKQKMTASLMWKFLMLNLAWLGCWMLLLSIIAYTLILPQVAYFLAGVLGLFVLTTSNVYVWFILDPSWKSFKKGIAAAFGKFHLQIVPFVLLCIAYILIAKLFLFIPSDWSKIGLPMATLVYAAFSRAYAARLIQSLDAQKND